MKAAANVSARDSSIKGRRKRMHDEALRARFEAMGLFSKWKKGARCAVLWALGSVPEELWARGVVCPAERAVMLGATSKRVRALLAGMQRRVPAAVRVVESASMDAVAGGLGGRQIGPSRNAPNLGFLLLVRFYT